MSYENRPGISQPEQPGHADGRFLAEVAEQNVMLKNQRGIAAVCRSMRPMSQAPFDSNGNVSFLRSIVQREGADMWTWEDPSGLVPMWACRMISEIIGPDPDLRILEGADGRQTLYRRVLPAHTITTAPSRWAPIGPVRIAYGGTKAKDDVIDGDDAWVKDALSLAGQTIRRGMRFRCTDGDIRFEHDPEQGAWIRTDRRDGMIRTFMGADDMECREPGFRHATLTEIEPRIGDEPMTYTVDTNVTVKDALELCRDAFDVIHDWVNGDQDSLLNLVRSLAAPFLRSHPECAYVYQGPGGTGKSTLGKDLMAHLGDQATTLSLDLLSQPTAMSAENKMGDLMNHLLALSDDYDPTHGRFEKALSNLKTLLTGILPFGARRQGENSIDGIPQAVHIITTNYHLPVSSQEAEQRRFAFATISNTTTRARLYLPFRRKHGFWPFMLAGAVTWLMNGDRQCRSVAFVDLESLTDAEVAAVRQVLEEGIAYPQPNIRVNWKNIGLVRTSSRRGGEDGRPRTGYAPAPEGDGLHAVWRAVEAAVRGMRMEDMEPVAEPNRLIDADPDRWAGMLEEAGAGPRIFPCKPDKGPELGVIAHNSWKKAADDPTVVMDHTYGSHKVWGVCVADGYGWIDLDCHDPNRMSGWEQIQRESGPYGTPLLPHTFAVRTPSGGMHLLYRMPKGMRIKSKTGNLGQIDLKIGHNGYVLMGGSVLPDGRRYQPVDLPDGPIPDLPVPILRFLERAGAVEDENGNPMHFDPAFLPEPAQPQHQGRELGRDPFEAFGLGSGDGFAFGRPAGESDGFPDMSVIPEGQRNDTLYRWGFGRHMNHPGNCTTIDRDLMERGVKSGLKEEECRSILKSIHKGIKEA
ncbi:bifunctional DNA primase/polymerase [Bifidobacterium felsineum]|uniref:bifunctional DNA primase/polymerase n=1 Tax=Bifidobacterium felsineum TaxID=2045440 RepID=UPI001BDBFAA3|nr:bifunctional DNA primase/polymerase [Bifidobacterium felsineum]MBT1164572.1 bifunctional DNA primase/polymerase [Bifidobacterium felsineum]